MMIFSKSNGKESLRLRLWFLLPLAGVLLVTVLAIILSIHRHVSGDIDQNADDTAKIAEHLYQEGIDNTASMLGAAMEVLSTDQELRQALARNDRARLLQRSAPLFAELRKKYAKFKLTPVQSKVVTPPLIKECLANIECKVIDIVKKHNIVVLEGVAAYIDTARKEKRAVHAVGDGTFIVDGRKIDRRKMMASKLPYGV